MSDISYNYLIDHKTIRITDHRWHLTQTDTIHNRWVSLCWSVPCLNIGVSTMVCNHPIAHSMCPFSNLPNKPPVYLSTHAPNPPLHSPTWLRPSPTSMFSHPSLPTSLPSWESISNLCNMIGDKNFLQKVMVGRWHSSDDRPGRPSGPLLSTRCRLSSILRPSPNNNRPKGSCRPDQRIAVGYRKQDLRYSLHLILCTSSVNFSVLHCCQLSISQTCREYKAFRKSRIFITAY